MITFTAKEIILLFVSLISIFINIIQLREHKNLEKEKFTPIYNGLIGIFNDVKLKISNYYLRQNLLFNPQNPFKEIEALRWDFYEFIINSISHFDSIREQLVPIIKSIDANEDRVFKGADFGLTNEEKEQRQLFQEKWKEEQEILKKKRLAEIQK